MAGLAELALSLPPEEVAEVTEEGGEDIGESLGDAIADELWMAFESKNKKAFHSTIKNMLRALGVDEQE